MPTTLTVRSVSPRPLLLALAVGAASLAVPAWAQESGEGATSTTSTTTTTTTTEAGVTIPPVGESTTTTTTQPDPEDPTAPEEVGNEEVPVVEDTVPPRPAGQAAAGLNAGRVVRQQLGVAVSQAAKLAAAYEKAKATVLQLETDLDALELSLTSLAVGDRAAVRRVELARRQFEARAANAIVRGGLDDFSRYVATDDPNDIAVARTLLDTVLAADQVAVREYLQAKAEVDDELVRTAERLVDGRLSLEAARAQLVEARRAHIAAQFNVAVLQAGSDIVIHGFVFPVDHPRSFWDSFGAPRMMGTSYAHAHQGTDIMAPAGTKLFAVERGIITKMGTDVLGGTKIWVKGESGTYYYYAHLSAFAEGMVDGLVVDAGDVIGYVGDTGNARGGAPHLHFEIHPDGGAAINPYPLLKVVDQMERDAKAASG